MLNIVMLSTTIVIFVWHYSKSKGTGRWLVHSTAMPKVAFLTYEVRFFFPPLFSTPEFIQILAKLPNIMDIYAVGGYQ